MMDRNRLREAYAIPDEGRTTVRVNFVESADGAVTLRGRSGTLGGATDRALMSVLRSMADVVLIGAGTARVEGYGGLGLDQDDAAWRDARGLAPAPRLAIVSRSLDLDPSASTFADAESTPLVVTCAASPAERRDALAAVAEILVCGDDDVDLGLMLRMLARRGWTRVLCEGGPHLFGSLVDADLVDELCVTIAPRIVGGRPVRMVRGADETGRALELAGCFSDQDGFVFLRYRRLAP